MILSLYTQLTNAFENKIAYLVYKTWFVENVKVVTFTSNPFISFSV